MRPRIDITSVSSRTAFRPCLVIGVSAQKNRRVACSLFQSKSTFALRPPRVSSSYKSARKKSIGGGCCSHMRLRIVLLEHAKTRPRILLNDKPNTNATAWVAFVFGVPERIPPLFRPLLAHTARSLAGCAPPAAQNADTAASSSRGSESS